MVNAKGKCILKQLCSEVSGATGTAEAEKLNKEKFRIQSRAELGDSRQGIFFCLNKAC